MYPDMCACIYDAGLFRYILSMEQERIRGFYELDEKAGYTWVVEFLLLR